MSNHRAPRRRRDIARRRRQVDQIERVDTLITDPGQRRVTTYPVASNQRSTADDNRAIESAYAESLQLDTRLDTRLDIKPKDVHES